MTAAPVYAGGNLTLKSGGIGPDDYLFRKLPRGTWAKVIIRHGPGQSTEYHADLAALDIICKNRLHVCVGDLQRTAARQRVHTMNAAEFVRCYPPT